MGEFFNKGDFDGVASLYTADATAFPPASAMVKGRAAIGAMWKSMADQMTDPKSNDHRCQTIGPGGGARDRHLQFKNQKFTAERTDWKIRRDLGEGRKRLEACQ